MGQNYNLIANHQWQVMLHVFNERANVQFDMDNLISKFDILKKNGKHKKWEKKLEQVAVPQHGFVLINVIEYGVKHLNLKVSNVR